MTAEPLSQVRPVRDWLWEPYIPRGKLAILDGDPGVGKSLLTLDLAARLSRGGPLPDGKPSGRPHVTLLLSAEDGAADTIRPRAEAAGRRPRAASSSSPQTTTRRCSFPADLGVLETLIRERRPIWSSSTRSWHFCRRRSRRIPTSACARADSLARIAERTDCTILLVRHLRKKERRRRSIAGWVASVSSERHGAALMVAMHPIDPSLSDPCAVETQSRGSAPALGFRIRGAEPAGAVIDWTGPHRRDGRRRSACQFRLLLPRNRAAEWLRRELAEGPAPGNRDHRCRREDAAFRSHTSPRQGSVRSALASGHAEGRHAHLVLVRPLRTVAEGCPLQAALHAGTAEVVGSVLICPRPDR